MPDDVTDVFPTDRPAPATQQDVVVPAAGDKLMVDGMPVLLPLNPDDGPADFDEAVQSALGEVSEKAVAEFNPSDRQLYPIKSKIRPSLEPVLARHTARIADINNRASGKGATAADGEALRALGIVDAYAHDAVLALPASDPKRQAVEAIDRRIRARGSLTEEGAKFEKQEANRERDETINTLVKDWNRQLDVVTERCQYVLAESAPSVTEDDRRAALLLQAELASTTPRHGLALLRWHIRNAALDPEARGELVAALPHLAGLYEDPRSRYAGIAELWTLINTASDVVQSPDAAIAKTRLESVALTRAEIDRYVSNARDGGPDALNSEGQPVLFPPELPPAPLPMSRSESPPVRRGSSSVRREADEQRRRAWREAQE